jgi:hypothetical protein
MYGYHVYNLIARRLLPDKSADLIEKLKRLSNQHRVPLWASEFGANTWDWTKKAVALFENPDSNVSGWAFWPWKRVPSPHSEEDYMHLAAIRPSAAWIKLINSVGKRRPAVTVSRAEAPQAMADFVAAMRAEKLEVDERMRNILVPLR